MEQEQEMIFDSQYNVYNPKEQKLKMVVIGCGSTGSFTILTLAKLGFKNIIGIDDDKVENTNLPHQFYRFSDVGKFKITSLKEIVKDFTGLEITAINKRIDNDNTLMDNANIDLDTIVIFCLDTIEARKNIYNQIKDMPIKIIDTRMGIDGYQIYVIDLQSESEKKEYEKLLSQEETPTTCGSKGTIYNILSIASETCNILKRMDKGEKYPKKIMREMASLKILGS
jgi:tRNA A37 threonylcarbamoyladenosine dehydratase